MARQTLEQQRAQDTWSKSKGCSSEYVTLAKGLPTLMMNSGLMQTMAFLQEKGSRQCHYRKLGKHLRTWIHKRFSSIPEDFDGFMEAMMNADSGMFQDVTTEAFAWLRWMRQMAAARRDGGV